MITHAKGKIFTCRFTVDRGKVKNRPVEHSLPVAMHNCKLQKVHRRKDPRKQNGDIANIERENRLQTINRSTSDARSALVYSCGHVDESAQSNIELVVTVPHKEPLRTQHISTNRPYLSFLSPYVITIQTVLCWWITLIHSPILRYDPAHSYVDHTLSYTFELLCSYFQSFKLLFGQ